MRTFHDRWFKVFGVLCVAAGAWMLVPELAAQRFMGGDVGASDAPVGAEDVRRAGVLLQVRGVIQKAGGSVDAAWAAADLGAGARFEEIALERADQAFADGNYDRAAALARAFVLRRADQPAAAPHPEDVAAEAAKEGPQKSVTERDDEIDQARLLLAHAEIKAGRPAGAVAALDAIAPGTPVDDFVYWLRGRAHTDNGEHAKAAAAYEKAYEADTTILRPYAQVRWAHALARSKQWKKALPALDAVLERFPDYPRRHHALYERARALEALGRLDQAAEAYQQAWFEFPHKEQGELARKRMRALAAKGHAPAPLSRHALFDRYRQLRINKHWPLARELFTELMEANATADGHSAFEHEIWLQLALNAYIPQWNAEALRWLEKLREAYEAGHTAGISDDLVYKYLSRVYGRLGRFDDALAALERKNAHRGAYTQKAELAQFYDDYGQYEKAREIYDTYYSDWRKRGWQYTWLLYKSGDFKQAYDNLTRLAERSGGQRRAKYMYWAARTLERAGDLGEAKKLYRDVARAYDLSYYGIQAENRLLDIKQREAVDGVFLATKTEMLEAAGEEAISAMDAANRRASQAASQPVSQDPRLIPRTGDGRPTPPSPAADSISAAKCDAETPADLTFCRMQAGEMPPEARRALDAVISPVQPYLGVFSTRADASQPATLAGFDDTDRDDLAELGDAEAIDAPAPSRAAAPKRDHAPRVPYNTDARIYWEGRQDSPIAFVRAKRGEIIGPVPDKAWAYDATDYRGGLDRAVDAAGDLFPNLVRAQWLRQAGLDRFARKAIRDVALEFDGLSKRYRPRAAPHELPHDRWAYYIDNRRRGSDLWGDRTGEDRFPVPSSASARRALLERQQAIFDRRSELEPLLLDAMKDVGDYHLVRRHTFGTGPWYRKDPTGPARDSWMQAYPRAFPELVLREARKNGVNPYLLWAVMTVESSYNPDSISPAEALGLLQVIPRTGIKTAQMLGDKDFGPYDLVEEETAIRHGAFYFSKLIDKFRGQELLAIAGYNGGPHRVGEWMDKRGEGMPMDEFVEEIPFDEARGYVKKVIRFLAIYLRVYEGVDELYIGQNMRLDYLPDPNF